MSQELDIDVETLAQAADSQLWEHQYREALLLTSAETLAWAKTSGPLRYLKVILEMQRLALDKFASMVGKDVRTAEEARRLAHTSFEMERLLLGQATIIGARVGDDDLDARIEWLQKRLKVHEDAAIEGKKIELDRID